MSESRPNWSRELLVEAFDEILNLAEKVEHSEDCNNNLVFRDIHRMQVKAEAAGMVKAVALIKAKLLGG